MRVDSRPAPAPPASSPKTWTMPSGTTYREPADGTALAKGHGGDAVKALQQRLNAAGLKPPLDVDGLLGPKTEAALLKLTGSATFDANAQATLAQVTAHAPTGAPKGDGFDTKSPPTQSAPQLPVGNGVVSSGVEVANPAQAAPVSGSLAEKTLAVARQELGSIDPRKTGADGKYHGWQHLQDVFEKTTGWRPTDQEIQASSQPQKKSWCGIFAAHVLQEAGANVKWDLNKGKLVGDVQQVMAPPFRDYRTYKTERQAFENSIKPGDVITLNGKLNHHAIVTSVNADGTVNTIDGNKPHVGEGHQKLADVTSYYRPTGGDAPAPG